MLVSAAVIYTHAEVFLRQTQNSLTFLINFQFMYIILLGLAIARIFVWLLVLRSEIPSGMCATLRTVAASNYRDHARNVSSRTLVIKFSRSHVNICRATTSLSLLLLLARASYTMVLFFTHIPFVVNHIINATPPERLQQHPLHFTTNHTDRTFFAWRLNSARPSHPCHSTILLPCLSLCNTQARAVNLIHAVLCDDEGVTQARGC